MTNTTWTNALSIRVIAKRTGKQVFYKECATVDAGASGNNELVIWYADRNNELQRTTYKMTARYWFVIEPINLRDVMHINE